MSFASAFVFKGFITNLKNPFTGERWLPKQILKKLGVTQTYKKKCENTENAAKIAKSSVVENLKQDAWMGIFFRMIPFITRSCLIFRTFSIPCLVQLKSPCFLQDEEEDHLVFHSTMYPRKGNSCSYRVEFNSNGMTAYRKLACNIASENLAYGLTGECKKTGIFICQDLPFPQDQF